MSTAGMLSAMGSPHKDLSITLGGSSAHFTYLSRMIPGMCRRHVEDVSAFISGTLGALGVLVISWSEVNAI